MFAWTTARSAKEEGLAATANAGRLPTGLHCALALLAMLAFPLPACMLEQRGQGEVQVELNADPPAPIETDDAGEVGPDPAKNDGGGPGPNPDDAGVLDADSPETGSIDAGAEDGDRSLPDGSANFALEECSNAETLDSADGHHIGVTKGEQEVHYFKLTGANAEQELWLDLTVECAQDASCPKITVEVYADNNSAEPSTGDQFSPESTGRHVFRLGYSVSPNTELCFKILLDARAQETGQGSSDVASVSLSVGAVEDN